jgi:preprotein translocase subunit SecD
MLDYIKDKFNTEISYRVRHAGIEFLLAQDAPVEGLLKKEYNNPSQAIYTDGKPVMTNTDIKEAILVKNDAYPGVEVILNANGIEKIKEVSSNNVGKRMAVMVNGQVICAPRLREPISDSHLQIAGSFTEAQAQLLVDIINGGRITSGGSSRAAAP